MVGEPSHVKQLSIFHVCKIGLNIQSLAQIICCSSQTFFRHWNCSTSMPSPSTPQSVKSTMKATSYPLYFNAFPHLVYLFYGIYRCEHAMILLYFKIFYRKIHFGAVLVFCLIPECKNHSFFRPLPDFKIPYVRYSNCLSMQHSMPSRL
jgi:hypothetical protein